MVLTPCRILTCGLGAVDVYFVLHNLVSYPLGCVVILDSLLLHHFSHSQTAYVPISMFYGISKRSL